MYFISSYFLLDMATVDAYTEEYEIIFELETKLRLFIENELSRLSDSWWEHYVPQGVKDNAERILARAQP